MSNIEIRPVSPRDAQCVLRLHKMVHVSDNQNFTIDHTEYCQTKQSIKMWIYRVIRARASHGFVAVINKKVIGTIFVEGLGGQKTSEVCEVTMLSVDPEYRGQSAGLALMERALSACNENKYLRKLYGRAVESNGAPPYLCQKAISSLSMPPIKLEGTMIDYIKNNDGTFSNYCIWGIDLLTSDDSTLS